LPHDRWHSIRPYPAEVAFCRLHDRSWVYIGNMCHPGRWNTHCLCHSVFLSNPTVRWLMLQVGFSPDNKWNEIFNKYLENYFKIITCHSIVVRYVSYLTPPTFNIMYLCAISKLFIVIIYMQQNKGFKCLRQFLLLHIVIFLVAFLSKFDIWHSGHSCNAHTHARTRTHRTPL
jgi:hypothetical protein